MILLFRFVCSVILLQGLYALNLTEIDVPAIVFIEKEEIDPIKLDCKYELDGEPTEFIVKWWKDDELIYQWIYGQEPAAIHPFEDDVKKYEVSTDPFQQYRGVILTNPNLNTTGSYKCVVRSYEGKDFDEKSLVKKLQVVHTASHSLNLYHRRIENETQVECTINDVYPKPSIDLKSDDGDPVQIISTNFNEDNGLFNATMVAVVADDDEDPDSYICTVMLPGLNLTRTEKSGSGLRKLEPGVWMILFILLRVH